MELALFGDQGADADAGIHPAMLAQIADAAAVGVAPLGLQLFDDLHGPDLGGAGDGAAGETGAQQVHRLPLRIQLAVDGGHQVMHRREGFHRKQAGHADRAGSADPADVVAQQIHDHQIFRSVLVGASELQGAGLIQRRVGQPRTGALDGLGLDMALVEQQETLGERLNMAPCGKRRKAEKGARLAWDSA